MLYHPISIINSLYKYNRASSRVIGNSLLSSVILLKSTLLYLGINLLIFSTILPTSVDVIEESGANFSSGVTALSSSIIVNIAS